MTRGNFFKSLVTLLAAPKILGEINFEKMAATNVATLVGNGTGSLISDLNLLTPYWYKSMIEKYADGGAMDTFLKQWLAETQTGTNE